MSVPPGPEQKVSRNPDPDEREDEQPRGTDTAKRDVPASEASSADTDGADTDGADTDRADTDPLLAQNPYGAGWGAGWGASWAETPQVENSGRPEEVERPTPARRTERSVMGDLELPPPPDPFAFPTSAPSAGAGTRGRLALTGLGALAVLAAIGGLVFWLTGRSPSSPATDVAGAETAATSTTTTTAQSQGNRRDPEIEARLMRVLAHGYPPGSCKPVDPAPGAVAMVNCGNNIDPGGPTSATYRLAGDRAALDAAFTFAVRSDAVVVCPGNIQSPGPWRRNATPQQISGTLVCGMQGNVATLAWTDEERLLISVVRAEPPGPTLDQLYQWWSDHS